MHDAISTQAFSKISAAIDKISRKRINFCTRMFKGRKNDSRSTSSDIVTRHKLCEKLSAALGALEQYNLRLYLIGKIILASRKGDNMNLSILAQLEELGIANDLIETDRSKKYLNITRDTGEFLSVLIKAINAKNILEIGTSNGYSTIWLASSVPEDGLVTTIEHSLLKHNEAKANFEKTQLERRIKPIHSDAQLALSNLTGAFDLIFLDADRHSYLAMVGDIINLLKPGGLLVTDNAISHEHELREFMTYFKNKPEFTCCLATVGKGQFMAHKSNKTNHA